MKIVAALKDCAIVCGDVQAIEWSINYPIQATALQAHKRATTYSCDLPPPTFEDIFTS